MSPVDGLLARAGVPVVAPRPLAGGDVASVVRCGEVVVKTAAGAPADFFEAEARGLRTLAGAGVRVPAVLHVEASGIVLEWLQPGPADWPDLARQLAALHRTPAPGYGAEPGIYLGSVPLPGGTGDSLQAWFRNRRIEPLIEQCGSILLDRRQAILSFADRFSPPQEGAVIVHGDLWSGNVHMSSKGAALIDPSCQGAERAYDLAMMRLFGGFPDEFWHAYLRAFPVPAALECALAGYQLVFVLAHVAMFGAGYLASVDRILREA